MQRTRDQLKAMFAKMRSDFNTKRNAAAGKVAEVRKGLGDEKKQAAAKARHATDWAIQQLKGFPVEKLVTNTIDYPFAWVEGVLANDIDRRASNIKTVAAKKLGQYQRDVTVSAAKMARRMHESKVGKISAGDTHAASMVSTSRAAMDAHLSNVTKPRSLRTTVDNAKWDKAVGDWWGQAMREGRQHFVPSMEEREMLLAKIGLPVTSKNEQELTRRITASYILGSRNDVVGSDRIGGL